MTNNIKIRYSLNWTVQLLLVSCVTIVVVGCGNLSEQEVKNRNFIFFKEVIGPVVIQYDQEHGELPIAFDTALREYPGKLPHRGDYFGNGYLYEKQSDQKCVFVSYGGNNQLDMGQGDDLVVVYESKEWSIGTANDAKFFRYELGNNGLPPTEAKTKDSSDQPSD